MDQFRKHRRPKVVGSVTRLRSAWLGSAAGSFTADNAVTVTCCPWLVGMVWQIQQVTLNSEGKRLIDLLLGSKFTLFSLVCTAHLQLWRGWEAASVWVTNLQRTITGIKVTKCTGRDSELQNNPGGPSLPVSSTAMGQTGNPREDCNITQSTTPCAVGWWTRKDEKVGAALSSLPSATFSTLLSLGKVVQIQP